MVSPQKISSYLRKPFELDATAETELRGLIKEYPYFNNAWLLLARSLHNQKSNRFAEVLPQAAMQAGDRSLLYKLVNIDEADAADLIKQTEQTAPQQPQVAETVAAVESLPQIEPIVVAEEPVAMAVEAEPVIQAIEREPEPQNEEAEKMASAYDEFFGAASAENKNADFEHFEITPAVAAEPVNVTAWGDDNTEEEFELQVADHLDDDGDGVVVPSPSVDTSEESFELTMLDTIASQHEEVVAEADLYNTEEDFVLDIAEKVAELESETYTAAFEPEITAQPEPEEELQAPVEEMQPIAFKLSPAISETPAPVEIHKAEETQEASVLITPSTFFEWLEQLKKHTPEKQANETSAPIVNDVIPAPTVPVETPVTSAPVILAVETPAPTPATPVKKI
ncbi:hypothetical protein QQ054_28060 [Oscillatoria amoena NRMC-F 0135]|nr:hypothetical protein [Oscillatoria amoena NRMC-F 0135]